MTRRRILVLSFFPAFSPPGSGGEVRTLELWTAVARHHDVVLISSTFMGGQAEEVIHAPHFREVRVPKDERAGEIWNDLSARLAREEVSALGVAFAAREHTAMHDAFLAEYDAADIIVHSFPYTLDYDLFFGLDAKPRVYDAHNAEYRLAEALYGGQDAGAAISFLAALERRLIEACDLVTVCSEEDGEALRALAPDGHAPIMVMPNGTRPAISVARGRRDVPRRALFIGSGHLPNRSAAEQIVRDVAPRLPEVMFDLVGDCLGPGTPLPPNITRHGIVAQHDKERLFAAADVALNTVTEGSGSNLKVADYLAHGLPLISTAFGARGFDLVAGRHFIAAEPDAAADALRDAMQDWPATAAMGEAGRAHIEARYLWSAIGDRYAAELSALDIDRAGPFEAGLVLALNDYPVSDSIGGGATRIRGLYAEIAPACPVVVLTLWGGEGVRRTEIAPGFIEICVPKTRAHREEERASNALYYASSADVMSIKYAPGNDLLVALYGFLRRFASRICIEHVYMVGLPKAFGDRFVHSSHNHETALKREILGGHPHAAALIALAAGAERHAVEAADLVIGVSPDDLTALTRGMGRMPPTMVVPNGVLTPSAPDAGVVKGLLAEIGSRSAVFLGSGHIPNVEAVQFLVRDVVPRCPDVTFHVVGSVSESFGPDLPPNLRLWGQVDEALKSAILSACALALNPVLSGGGSNVKFADYLAHGLCVLTTPFGLRGIPGADPHVVVSDRLGFAEAVTAYFDGGHAASARAERQAYFRDVLSLEAASRRFLRALQDLAVARTRVLVATYRFTDPPLGGAEAHMLRFVEALSADGRFDIDVLATDVEGIGSASRFRSTYPYSGEPAASPSGLPRVTVLRCPVDDRTASQPSKAALDAWMQQPAFEQTWMLPFADRLSSVRLLWGWSVERHGEEDLGRALFDAGLFVPGDVDVDLVLRASAKASVGIEDLSGRELDRLTFEGEGIVSLPRRRGTIRLRSAASPLTDGDPRPSAYWLAELRVDGRPLPLAAALLKSDEIAQGRDLIEVLAGAADRTRVPANLSVTDARGPLSPSYDAWLHAHAGDYDLIVTHNAVFRTTKAAIEAATRAGTPSILVAQVHLDDDFYHFPDVEQMVRDASLALLAPSQAVAFYEGRGAQNTCLLGAGADLDEPFGDADRRAFREVYPDRTPFVLVLGRKAQSKGYQAVIDAVDRLAPRRALKVVLIGPEEDDIPVRSSLATYLGRQDRAVVRGALLECAALANMSSSDSFGMVILEAWQAQRPVIANQACAAFQDLIADRQNGLLTSAEGLSEAIETVLDDGALVDQLLSGGRQSLQSHGWDRVCAAFLAACARLAGLEGNPDPA